MKKIPIKNIYYIFCYAWQKFEIGRQAAVGTDDNTEEHELFSKVLVHAVKHLVRRGIDRDYVEQTEDLSCPKGKIVFSTTIRRNLLHQMKLNCGFDDLSRNTLQNQILKTTLLKLSKVIDGDKNLRNETKSLARIMSEVDEIKIRPSDFKRVKIHRNNAYYSFLMKLCELINYMLLPDKAGERFRFADYLNDENRMGLVFEGFVRNFYAARQEEFKVRSEEIKWDVVASELAMDFLPKMQTDVSLKSNDRKIIIDTKYYKETLSSHISGNRSKIRSAHLYQLHAYLSNAEVRGPLDGKAEGILLYPTAQGSLDLKYEIKGHIYRVCTINLDQDWHCIENDLLRIIAVRAV